MCQDYLVGQQSIELLPMHCVCWVRIPLPLIVSTLDMVTGVQICEIYCRQGNYNFSATSPSVLSNSLQPHGLQPFRLLSSWDLLGKNTGVGCNFLLQGIFLTQGSHPYLLWLLHWQVNFLPMSHLGSHNFSMLSINSWQRVLALKFLQLCLDHG